MLSGPWQSRRGYGTQPWCADGVDMESLKHELTVIVSAPEFNLFYTVSGLGLRAST